MISAEAVNLFQGLPLAVAVVFLRFFATLRVPSLLTPWVRARAKN
jgi:hypothetical protein